MEPVPALAAKRRIGAAIRLRLFGALALLFPYVPSDLDAARLRRESALWRPGRADRPVCSPLMTEMQG